jgi:hypothetical protein
MRLEGKFESERESFIRNNLHNGVVSGAARRGEAHPPERERERESQRPKFDDDDDVVCLLSRLFS